MRRRARPRPPIIPHYWRRKSIPIIPHYWRRSSLNNDTVRLRIAARSSLAALKEPAFAILDRLQDEPRDVQLEALFLAAAALAEGAGLDPYELTSRARRQLLDGVRVRNPLIEALRDYAKGELR